MLSSSHKDKMYFTWWNTYNCPFCDRNNVTFSKVDQCEFNDKEDSGVYIYLISCNDCKNVSAHFSKHHMGSNYSHYNWFDFYLDEENTEIDNLFFWHKPNKFFLLDNHINRDIRELFDEAQSCLDSNLLTWASACIRKLLYTLISREECLGDDYESSFKLLKEKFPNIDSLVYAHRITQLMSDKLHEDSYEKWDSWTIRFLLWVVSEILYELYVLPDQKKQRYSAINELQKRK